MAQLREFKRVIGVTQVLYLIGRWLKRRGIRYTSLAIIICGSAIIVDIAGTGTGIFDKGFGWKQKASMAAIPAVIAFFTFGLGNCLTCLCNLFHSERILVADANSMNLMEDRKKADMGWHLSTLWDRVFKYEAVINRKRAEYSKDEEFCSNLRELSRDFAYPCSEQPDTTESCMDNPVNPRADSRSICEPRAMTRGEFFAAAHWALAKSSPQKYEYKVTGCNFSLIEDWYDGAFFTENDRKLQEQFCAHRSIRGIRQSVGIPWYVKPLETLIGHPPPIWHFLTMKKIGLSVGILINRMNRKYCGTNHSQFFDAQDFLWNGSWFESVALQTFGDKADSVVEDLSKRRRRMFRAIFSDCRQCAFEQIYRMFGPDYVNAMNLRLDYDVEYAAGILDNTPNRDVEELSEILLRQVFSKDIVDAKVQRAQLMLKRVDDFLTANLPLVLENPSALRAARIGFYINKHRIQEKVAKNPTEATSLFQVTILESTLRYVRRLCLLRQHHELTRLQLLSYVQMVDELAQYDASSECVGRCKKIGIQSLCQEWPNRSAWRFDM
ncbi:hypothetical protein ACFL5Z_02415 [Planctomycetota bacterium]